MSFVQRRASDYTSGEGASGVKKVCKTGNFFGSMCVEVNVETSVELVSFPINLLVIGRCENCRRLPLFSKIMKLSQQFMRLYKL